VDGSPNRRGRRSGEGMMENLHPIGIESILMALGKYFNGPYLTN
jgi:hypothetical protein